LNPANLNRRLLVAAAGFRPFAWYRIVVGILAIWLLSR